MHNLIYVTVYVQVYYVSHSHLLHDEICPGDDVTFTCVVVDPIVGRATVWSVTPGGGEPSCRVPHNDPDETSDTCGPGGVFTSSLTNRSGDSYISTLRVESISDGLNGTRVECEDALQMDVGMENICIISKAFIASVH